MEAPASGECEGFLDDHSTVGLHTPFDNPKVSGIKVP